MMRTITSDRTSINDLDHIYPLPVIADERMFHDDLAAMSAGSLRREVELVRLRLLVDRKPHRWLIERFELLTRGAVSAN